MKNEITELAKALSNVNINSDTASQIAEAYFRYKYIELFSISALLGVLILGVIGIFAYLIHKEYN